MVFGHIELLEKNNKILLGGVDKRTQTLFFFNLEREKKIVIEFCRPNWGNESAKKRVAWVLLPMPHHNGILSQQTLAHWNHVYMGDSMRIK